MTSGIYERTKEMKLGKWKRTEKTKIKMSETRKKLFKEGILKPSSSCFQKGSMREKCAAWKGGISFKKNKTKFGSKEFHEKLKKSHKEKFENKPELRIKYGKSRKKFWKEHPEKHPNRVCAKNGFISKPQMELYLLIKQKYPDAELEYPIITNYSTRFADIGIPSKKLDIEFDGEYWHNKWFDDLRDKQLIEVGWKTLRFTKNNIHLCYGRIQNE
jgi:hypothetical protein